MEQLPVVFLLEEDQLLSRRLIRERKSGSKAQRRTRVAVLAACLCVSASFALAQGSAATDRAALVALYNATDGSNWTNNTNWLNSGPLSEWIGVSAFSDDRVFYLDLDFNLGASGPIGSGSGNNLRGSIPPELGQLTELTNLNLGYDDLSGPIPPELGNLTNLTVLYLPDNGLTGSIPGELGNLTNLTWLYLRDNELTGSIPGELGNLTNLDDLGLANNRLTGQIPVELGNLTNLTALGLGGNQLTGPIPAELGNLTNLIELYIDSDTGLCLASDFPLASAFARLSDLSVCVGTEPEVPTPALPFFGALALASALAAAGRRRMRQLR